MAKGRSRVIAENGDTRIAPDPFAAVLPAIAALGAVSSIAAINWSGRERAPERTRPKRKASNALRELETCCIHLTEIFRRFQRNPSLFLGEGGASASPLKFGVHGPRVTLDAAKVYQIAVNDVASMLVLASQNSFDVMCAIEDETIELPEDIFFGLGECQDKLNQLIQSRATLKDTVDTGAEVAARLTAIVSEMKKYRQE